MAGHGPHWPGSSSGSGPWAPPVIRRNVAPATGSMGRFSGSLGPMFTMPEKRPVPVAEEDDEPPDVKKARVFFGGFAKLHAEEVEPTDYCQMFQYYNETTGWSGWLRLAWRHDELNLCLTSCSYCDVKEWPGDDAKWTDWHGRWKCVSECGHGLRIYFDYLGCEHCLAYWDKFTTVWSNPVPPPPWAYKGEDYQKRTVWLRAAEEITCIADTLGHPECGAELVPSKLGGRPWKQRT